MPTDHLCLDFSGIPGQHLLLMIMDKQSDESVTSILSLEEFPHVCVSVCVGVGGRGTAGENCHIQNHCLKLLELTQTHVHRVGDAI